MKAICGTGLVSIVSDTTALINAIVDHLNQEESTTSTTISDKAALINALLPKGAEYDCDSTKESG